METFDLAETQKFLEARIGSLKNDTQRCFSEMENLRPAPFPAVMYSMATLDLFSSLWAGWNDKRTSPLGKKDPRSQVKRMSDFLEKYLSYPQKESQLAIIMWRHKLMHTAEPRSLTELLTEDANITYSWLLAWKLQKKQHWKIHLKNHGSKEFSLGIRNFVQGLENGIFGPNGYFQDLENNDGKLRENWESLFKEFRNYKFVFES